VGLLSEAFAPALLLWLGTRGFRRLLLALRHGRTALALAIPVAILVAIAIMAAIAVAEAAMVPSEAPIVPTAAFVPVARLIAAVLTRWRLRLMRQRRLEAVVEPLFPLVVAELVADIAHLGSPAHALAIAVDRVDRRLGQLLAISHDDARIMLGVLQIILCQHGIARRLRIAGERKILLRDMRRRPPDFHVRSVGFEAARQRIVVFPIVIPAATAAILLSLPHCPSGSYVTSTGLFNAQHARASMVLLASGLGSAEYP
jgi:hypothetical protein